MQPRTYQSSLVSQKLELPMENEDCFQHRPLWKPGPHLSTTSYFSIEKKRMINKKRVEIICQYSNIVSYYICKRDEKKLIKIKSRHYSRQWLVCCLQATFICLKSLFSLVKTKGERCESRSLVK